MKQLKILIVLALLAFFASAQTSTGDINSDLNTFTTPGWYLRWDDNLYGNSWNFPESTSGMLLVTGGTAPDEIVQGRRYQTFTTSGGHVYVRSLIYGTWMPWAQQATMDQVTSAIQSNSGDAGGDLNTFNTAGRYLRWDDNNFSSSDINFPEKVSGMLIVSGSNPTSWIQGRRYQTYQTSTNHLYVRSSVWGNWGAWTKMASEDFAEPRVATSIGTNADLNTFMAPGKYVVGYDGWAASGTNYPEPVQGALTVIATSDASVAEPGSRFQTYQTRAGHFYIRSAYGGNWSAWQLQTALSPSDQIKDISDNSTSLDGLTAAGNYFQAYGLYATPVLGYPESSGGCLTVSGTNNPTAWVNGQRFQTYQTVSNHIYTRSMSSGIWSTWILQTPQSLSDQTKDISDNNTSLDGLTVAGTYFQAFALYATTALGYPETSGGTLTVSGTNNPTAWVNGQRFQTYQTVSNHIYTRSMSNGIWSSWALQTGSGSTFSGNYNDLTNKPAIPDTQVNSDWNATSGVAQILNRPDNYLPPHETTVPSILLSQAFNLPTYQNKDATMDFFTNDVHKGNGFGLIQTDYMASPVVWLYGNVPNAFTVGIKDYTEGGDNTVINNMRAALQVRQDGKVLIGKTSSYQGTDYKLDVAGAIRANKLTVNTTGADFVFDSSYRLQPLAEVENYVKQNQHLPGIVPASDMQKDGVEVGESQTKLLQKIEELTLYAIAQDKKIAEQDRTINAQRLELEARMREMELKIGQLLKTSQKTTKQ